MTDTSHPSLRRPKVVVIDDVEVIFDGNDAAVKVEWWQPSQVDQDEFKLALEDADVIVVDQQLFPEGDRPVPPAAADGLAMVAVLQRYLAYIRPSELVTFALFSGALDSLSSLPLSAQTHVIARTHGFEWAFGKGQSGDLTPFSPALSSLAAATRRTAEAYASTRGRPYRRAAALQNLLGIGESAAPWAQNAWSQVLASRPPISRTVDDSSGAVLLRWMLHRVLPYPTFLYDTAQTAARVGLTRTDMESLAENELRHIFESAKYDGMLGDFLGRRYWKAGVEYALQEISEDSSDSLSVRDALEREAGHRLRFVEHPRPVVALGVDMIAQDTPVDPRNTVRIQPEDWPIFAEPARVLKELAEEEADVYALVVPSDQLTILQPDEEEQ